jgi:hypothetical protein
MQRPVGGSAFGVVARRGILARCDPPFGPISFDVIEPVRATYLGANPDIR